MSVDGGQPIKCACGQYAVSKISKKDNENNGRSFYACPNPQETSCRYFCWAEDDPYQALQRLLARGSAGSGAGVGANFQRGGAAFVGGFSQRGGAGLGRGQRGGYGQQSGSSRPGGNFAGHQQSAWEKPYSVITPSDGNHQQSSMDVELSNGQQVGSGAVSVFDPATHGGRSDDAVCQRLDKCERSITELLELFNKNMSGFLTDIKTGLEHQQGHLEAITKWIQSHVEEQEDKTREARDIEAKNLLKKIAQPKK